MLWILSEEKLGAHRQTFKRGPDDEYKRWGPKLIIEGGRMSGSYTEEGESASPWMLTTLTTESALGNHS
jgi:hypothetical protein